MPADHSHPEASRYAPVAEGTQVFRTCDEPPAFRVHCRCGYQAGPYVSAETAEAMRTGHEAGCLWPKR